MKNLAIANSGGTSQGKSTTIKEIYYVLRDKYEPANTPLIRDGDIKAIINAGSIKIGIESQGDPNSRQGDSIDEFVEERCDIIIAACRTRGYTLNKLWDLGDKGYDVVWASNYRCVNKNLRESLNRKYVDSIVSIVDGYIDQSLSV